MSTLYTKKELISLVAESVHGQLCPSPIPQTRVLHNYPRPDHSEMREVRFKGGRAVGHARVSGDELSVPAWRCAGGRRVLGFAVPLRVRVARSSLKSGCR